MAWELKKVEDQRKMLIESYLKGSCTMTELCNQFGVSRKTAYKWLRRYESMGINGLKDQPKAPHNPKILFKEEDIQMAIDLKLKHWRRGPKKILEMLFRNYPKKQWPSPTRLYEIFKQNNLTRPKRIKRRVPATHPLGEVNNSNDIWTADFKGWVLTGNGQKWEPLTITDSFSRYLIRCKHLEKKTVEHVWTVFEEAFKEYGLPLRVRTDNGPPFGSIGVGRLTGLSVKLIKAGVTPEWITPGHPEENGRHERFHLTLQEEVANPTANTLEEQIIRAAHFIEEYNFDRPHEGLGMNSPGNLYTSSSRQWDGKLRSPEYDTNEMSVRKVGQNGCIWICQKEYYVGQVLTGEYVGLREGSQGIEICYGPVHLGRITQEEIFERPKAVPKKVVRRR
jgi:putative transposase